MVKSDPITPVSLTEKQQKRREKIDKGLSAILELLNSGAAAKVPLVQSAFGAAARIFEISQNIRSNQDEFVEFAEEGYRLVYIISQELTNGQEIEQGLKNNLEELLETLQSIQSFGEKCAARGTIKAVFLHGFDANAIKAQRRKLERCMGLFNFQSLLDLRMKTNKLVGQQVKGDPNYYLDGVSETTTNTNNVTENKISFGSNANFDQSSGNVMGSGNVVNHNSKNYHGGGAGRISTSTENANNRANNTISFGDGANFGNTTGNVFGANNEVNHNSGNVFGSNNASNSNSENKPDSQGNNQQRTSVAKVNKTTNSNNTTMNDIKFGNNANFTGSNGNVLGSDNRIDHSSNNVYDSSHNKESHTVSHWGNNNKTQIGKNNAENQTVIGGSNNTVNSGSNSGHQFFPNASNFNIEGGEFNAIGGNKNDYGQKVNE